jgi:hypothetical protein
LVLLKEPTTQNLFYFVFEYFLKKIIAINERQLLKQKKKKKKKKATRNPPAPLCIAEFRSLYYAENPIAHFFSFFNFALKALRS